MELTDAKVEPYQTDGFVLRKALVNGVEVAYLRQAISTNIFTQEDAEGPLDHQISPRWLRRLRRRSQRYRLIQWNMMQIAEHWLPGPKLRHPCPDWRFDVMTRGESPVR